MFGSLAVLLSGFDFQLHFFQLQVGASAWIDGGSWLVVPFTSVGRINHPLNCSLAQPNHPWATGHLVPMGLWSYAIAGFMDQRSN